MKITVNVADVTLDSVLGGVVTDYDPETGGTEGHDVTLRDAVAEVIAERAIKADSENGWALRNHVAAVREELIRELLTPLVTEALDTPAQRTNAFGEPHGEPVSMRVLVMHTAQKMLDAQVDSSGRPERYAARDRTSTYASFLIEKIVREVFAQELQAELDAAKAELRDTLQQVAAAKLAEAVPVR